MSYSDQSHLFRQIVMDHYRNPRNKGLAKDPRGYMTVRLKNPSCGDDLTVQIKTEGEKILEIRQQGEGCSICCASASMMSELLEAETISEAEEIIRQFKLMVQAEDYDAEKIGDAVSLQGVSRLPQRVKCATLGWQAAERGLKQIQKNRSEGRADHHEGAIEADVDKEDEHEI